MASSLTNLPAPGSAETERAERKAAFIRETSAKVLVELMAINPKSPSISAVVAVDAAKLLAKALENNDYL